MSSRPPRGIRYEPVDGRKLKAFTGNFFLGVVPASRKYADARRLAWQARTTLESLIRATTRSPEAEVMSLALAEGAAYGTPECGRCGKYFDLLVGHECSQ